MSTGGVIGGAFVAVVAPIAFDGVWEYPLLVVGALIALAVPIAGAGADASGRRQRPIRRLSPVPGADDPVRAGRDGPDRVHGRRPITRVRSRRALAAVGGLVLLVGGVRWFLVATTALVLVLATFVLPQAAMFRDRSFFGVVEVYRTRRAHDVAPRDDRARLAVARSRAARRSRLVLRAAAARWATCSPSTTRRVRTAARSACWASAPARWRRSCSRAIGWCSTRSTRSSPRSRADTPLLHLSRRCRLAVECGSATGGCPRARGDATLDLVMMDAFSSDAVPVHLITQEALAEGLRTLRPAASWSSTCRTATTTSRRRGRCGAAGGVTILEKMYSPTPRDVRDGAAPSHWLVGLTDPAAAKPFTDRGWRVFESDVTPLTDDYPNLFRFLTWGREGRPVATSRPEDRPGGSPGSAEPDRRPLARRALGANLAAMGRDEPPGDCRSPSPEPRNSADLMKSIEDVRKHLGRDP